jgi:hypothetical protein
MYRSKSQYILSGIRQKSLFFNNGRICRFIPVANFSTTGTENREVLFKWRERPEGAGFSNGFMDNLRKNVFFKILSNIKENEVLEGAKAAFETSLYCIFQHPDLVRYQNDLEKRILSPNKTNSSTSTEAETSSTSSPVTMNDIFTPKLTKFFEDSVQTFIKQQRAAWEQTESSASSSTVPLNKIYYELLDISSFHMQKTRIVSVRKAPRKIFEELQDQHNFTIAGGIPDIPEDPNSRHLDLATVHCFVDFHCRGKNKTYYLLSDVK